MLGWLSSLDDPAAGTWVEGFDSMAEPGGSGFTESAFIKLGISSDLECLFV